MPVSAADIDRCLLRLKGRDEGGDNDVGIGSTQHEYDSTSTQSVAVGSDMATRSLRKISGARGLPEGSRLMVKTATMLPMDT